jgi:hypothetical protein
MSISTSLPRVQEEKPTLEEGAAELYRLLEEHFDEMGLTEAERDERYARAEQRVIAEGAADAKAST